MVGRGRGGSEGACWGGGGGEQGKGNERKRSGGGGGREGRSEAGGHVRGAARALPGARQLGGVRESGR